MVTPLPAYACVSAKRSRLGRVAAAVAALSLSAATVYAAPPEIRSSAENAVPRCVTPKRLMAFVKARTPNLDARYANIAELYKRHGETWHVRWDYAFFQMAVETNFLSYKKGDGEWGDVKPKQNNFAGLGTTGGGVPGDSYPDINAGVLAQIQHLVVYSGERIADPVGARTKLKQDDILESIASRNGHTTFADLSRRWAADRHYGASIEWVANSYRDAYCKNPEPEPAEEAAIAPKPKKRMAAVEPLAPAAALGAPEPAVEQPVIDQSAAEAALPEPATANDAAPPKTTTIKSAPVRTVWSADASVSEPSVEDAAKPTAPQVVRKARIAPVPARKPVIAAAADPTLPPVGDAQPSAEAAAESGSPTAEPSAPADSEPVKEIETATTAEQPPAPAEARSFAFAGVLTVPAPSPAPRAAANDGQCRVLTASYGGKKVFLVRSLAAAETRYTVLTVLEGFERSMLDTYFKAHAPGGSSVGEFESKDAALAKAKELCPGTAAAPRAEGASAG